VADSRREGNNILSCKAGYTTIMSQAKPINNLLPMAEDLRRELIVRFLAELFQMTGDPNDQAAFQSSLQTFVDELRPWLDAKDGPPSPRAVFTLLKDFSFDAAGEEVSVVLSPEAEALFRAWLRRNKIWSDAGLNTAHAWLN
jgi:hypothetical protein